MPSFSALFPSLSPSLSAPSLSPPPSSLPITRMNVQCVNENNLAYIAALFPESNILREQLKDVKPRRLANEEPSESVVYSSLLSTTAIPEQKTQTLFLLMLVCGAYVCEEGN